MKLVSTYNLKIIEKHLDTFGHVNNATYLQLYEEARWDLTTSRGYGLSEIRKEQKGPTILNIDISFKRELFNREEIIIETFYSGMKNKLIMNIHQRMINSENKEASSIDLEIGVIDLEKRKLIPPTTSWWNAIGVAQNEIGEIGGQ